MLLRFNQRLASVMLLALFGFLSLAVFAPTYACSCVAPGAPKAELEKFNTVFRGKVTKVTSSELNSTVEFDAQTIWKGDVKSEYTVGTAKDSAACGVNFEQGKEYVVYANKDEGKLVTYLCSRTAEVADASQDIKDLGEGEGIVRTMAAGEDDVVRPISAPYEQYAPISAPVGSQPMFSVMEVVLLMIGVLNLVVVSAVLVKSFMSTKVGDLSADRHGNKEK